MGECLHRKILTLITLITLWFCTKIHEFKTNSDAIIFANHYIKFKNMSIKHMKQKVQSKSLCNVRNHCGMCNGKNNAPEVDSDDAFGTTAQ